jgi:hypothetical protein
MPVFISHRTADNSLAAQVALSLRFYHEIECYIDDIDQELAQAQGTPAVTALIVTRLNQCTNLLAIVTANTEGSWWVPFEVGVARQAPRVITTFTNQSDYLLPEFLLEWPRLRGDSAVDEFARLYKAQQRLLKERVLEKRAMFSDQLNLVDQFQRQLKALLGQ